MPFIVHFMMGSLLRKELLNDSYKQLKFSLENKVIMKMRNCVSICFLIPLLSWLLKILISVSHSLDTLSIA